MDDYNYNEISESILIKYKSGIADIGKNITSVTHYHNVCEFVLFKKCSLQIFAQNNWYDISDGEIVFIPKYTLHRIDYNDTTNYSRLLIHFDSDALSARAIQFGCIDFPGKLDVMNFHVYRPTPGLFRQLMEAGQAAAKTAAASNPMSEQTISALTTMRMILMLYDVQRLFSSTAIPASVNDACKFVKDAIDYIDSHYSSEIRLDDLARALHVDKYYLCHMFKKNMHVTITKYVQSRRIIEAQKQLMHSSKPLDIIASECGFNSLQYFYKVFRQVSGHTPLDFR